VRIEKRQNFAVSKKKNRVSIYDFIIEKFSIFLCSLKAYQFNAFDLIPKFGH